MSTQLTSTSSHMGAVLGRVQVTQGASVTYVGDGHDLHHAMVPPGSKNSVSHQAFSESEEHMTPLLKSIYETAAATGREDTPGHT